MSLSQSIIWIRVCVKVSKSDLGYYLLRFIQSNSKKNCGKWNVNVDFLIQLFISVYRGQQVEQGEEVGVAGGERKVRQSADLRWFHLRWFHTCTLDLLIATHVSLSAISSTSSQVLKCNTNCFVLSMYITLNFFKNEKAVVVEGEGSRRGDAHILMTSEMNRTRLGNRKSVSYPHTIFKSRDQEIKHVYTI